MSEDVIGQLESRVSELEAMVVKLAESNSASSSDTNGSFINRAIPVIGGGGGEYGAFSVVDGEITNRYYMVSRSVFNVSGSDPSAEDGTWYLVVPHASPGSATLTTSPSGITNDTQTVIPLFTINDGEIVQDWRGMPIVMIRE